MLLSFVLRKEPWSVSLLLEREESISPKALSSPGPILTFYPSTPEWDGHGFWSEQLYFFLSAALQPVSSDYLSQSLWHDCFAGSHHLLSSPSIPLTQKKMTEAGPFLGSLWEKAFPFSFCLVLSSSSVIILVTSQATLLLPFHSHCHLFHTSPTTDHLSISPLFIRGPGPIPPVFASLDPVMISYRGNIWWL